MIDKGTKMIIAIEEGASGLWYAISATDGPYKGLLIAERTLDEVLDKISPTIKAMREAHVEVQRQKMNRVD